MLPLGTSAVIVGFGFLVALGHLPIDLRVSPLLIPIAHALVALPFVVRATVPVLRSIDRRLREAARVLGASPARVWREIDLPIVSRAALVGAGFAFAVSLGEFGATLFIVRPDTPTMPIAIFRLLSQPGALAFGQAMAMATLLMFVTGASVLAFDRLRADEESAAADARVDRRSRRLRRDNGARRHRPRVAIHEQRPGRAGTERIGQVDPAARDRRPRAAQQWPDRTRRAGSFGSARPRARLRPDVPGLRPVSAARRRRQRGLRARDARGRARLDRQARVDEVLALVGLPGYGSRRIDAAVRRGTATRVDCPGARADAAPADARRAARRARPRAAHAPAR